MELRDQCMMARVAFANLKTGINSSDRYLCWSLVQTILASISNISKIFWPAYDKDKAEKSKNHVLTHRNILSEGSMNISNDDLSNPTANMGTLESTTFRLTFWNDSIEIPVLMKSIEELLASLEKKLVE